MFRHDSQHRQHQQSQQTGSDSYGTPLSFWRTSPGRAVLLLAALAVFVLVTEHWVHLTPIFPYFFLFGCVFMHVFRHHGHHHSRHSRHRDECGAASDQDGKTEKDTDHAS